VRVADIEGILAHLPARSCWLAFHTPGPEPAVAPLRAAGHRLTAFAHMPLYGRNPESLSRTKRCSPCRGTWLQVCRPRRCKGFIRSRSMESRNSRAGANAMRPARRKPVRLGHAKSARSRIQSRLRDCTTGIECARRLRGFPGSRSGSCRG
jgi:hypothetical protein